MVTNAANENRIRISDRTVSAVDVINTSEKQKLLPRCVGETSTPLFKKGLFSTSMWIFKMFSLRQIIIIFLLVWMSGIIYLASYLDSEHPTEEEEKERCGILWSFIYCVNLLLFIYLILHFYDSVGSIISVLHISLYLTTLPGIDWDEPYGIDLYNR